MFLKIRLACLWIVCIFGGAFLFGFIFFNGLHSRLFFLFWCLFSLLDMFCVSIFGFGFGFAQRNIFGVGF